MKWKYKKGPNYMLSEYIRMEENNSGMVDQVRFCERF